VGLSERRGILKLKPLLLGGKKEKKGGETPSRKDPLKSGIQKKAGSKEKGH